MSVKLLVLVVTVLGLAAFAATTVKAQQPADSDAEAAAATGPTFEQLVEQRVASTLQVVNVLAAKSSAPAEVKEAVVANAQQEMDACAAQALVDRLPGPFFACSGHVISNASNALSVASSSGAASAN
ncbi:uncharacterized protein LOC109397606 isoform X2 [Aedes albopictus]|uniref:Secreted protein n=1 Tax=Aedes albopictus TaxID=7160 RepID=A0ABM1ZID0_AEDAL|nr:hypothetical protein RP20_CCG013056 [Aedes albopictus]